MKEDCQRAVSTVAHCKRIVIGREKLPKNIE